MICTRPLYKWTKDTSDENKIFKFHQCASERVTSGVHGEKKYPFATVLYKMDLTTEVVTAEFKSHVHIYEQEEEDGAIV